MSRSTSARRRAAGGGRLAIFGRSEDKAAKIIGELKGLNPDGEAFFLQKDVSLLRNVDEFCAELEI